LIIEYPINKLGPNFFFLLNGRIFSKKNVFLLRNNICRTFGVPSTGRKKKVSQNKYNKVIDPVNFLCLLNICEISFLQLVMS